MSADLNEFTFKNESLPSGYNMADRLDENFWFLMNLIEKDVGSLTDEMKNIVSKWFVRLGSYAMGIDYSEKAQRNFYMHVLIDCIQKRHLIAPFNIAPPETGPLPMITEKLKVSDIEDRVENPQWLKNLIENESQTPYVGGRNFESYLSTKFFEDGRGACAYIAVTATNENEAAGWSKFRLKEREKKLEKIYEQEKKFMEEALDENLLDLDDSDNEQWVTAIQAPDFMTFE